MPAKECHVCDGRHTVDTLVWLQLGPPGTIQPGTVPLCRTHFAMCEGAIYEMRKIQSPPCVVNVQAVGTGSSLGKIG